MTTWVLLVGGGAFVRVYVEDTDLTVTSLLGTSGRVVDVPRREETTLDFGALVAPMITR